MNNETVHLMMFRNALIGLENGQLMPWDKDLLSRTPLPSTVIDPFTTKEMPDVLESMKLTFNAMSIWIDEAKKVNYFSKRFVQLSKMVMNGVTTMGRGLVTLHQRGEDLRLSPMSIQDLLGVASYHFRKSYLGVLQTSRSHPEIGERLLMNQIGWNNMLMRLFKTRDKLSESSKSKVQSSNNESLDSRVQSSALESADNRIQESGTKSQEAPVLPDTSDLLVQALSHSSQGSEFKPLSSGFSAPSAIREPGALTAPRAFSAFDNRSRGSVGSKDQGARIEGLENEDGRMKNEENRIQDPGSRDVRGARTQGLGTSEGLGERDKGLVEENRTENKEKIQIKENEQKPEDEKNQKEQLTGEKKQKENQAERDNGTHSNYDNEDNPVTGPSPVESPIEEKSPAGEGASESDLPPYLQILKNVFDRSGPSENGEVTFTFDEITYLAADPDFNRIYPDQAAQMRSILQNLNSS